MLTPEDKQQVMNLVERVVNPAIDDAVEGRLRDVGFTVQVGPRAYRVRTHHGDHDIGGCTDVLYSPDWVKLVAGEVTVALFPRDRVQWVMLVRGEADGE